MPDRYRPVTSSLRSRLLILTIIFVMIVEVFVYVPSIATYRQTFLEERLVAAQIAGLSLEEAPNNSVSPQLEEELLTTAGVISVAMLREDRSLMLGFDRMPDETDGAYDLRTPTLAKLINDAFETLGSKGERIITVVGRPAPTGTRFVEVTLEERPLYVALTEYSNTILVISLLVSVFTGVLVYLALHWMVVRPMRHVKNSIVDFRRHPEAKTKMRVDCRRRDEIGVVERELARMQDELRSSLAQKTRLAELGEAVSKINHDLRNILATAQLASESLERVEHPGVQRVSGRLMTSVSRAVKLCERTLKHGSALEPEPEKKWFTLVFLLRDVADSLGILDSKHFRFKLEVDEQFRVYADPEQLHRVLLNLIRNAVDIQGENGSVNIAVEGDEDGAQSIFIRDKGPGIPAHIKPNLFKPFMTGNSRQGTGLGLSIAREIIVAHGGSIDLEYSGAEGTSFKILLPAENV